MPQVCNPKVCRCCQAVFQPTSRKQWRCVPCKDVERRPDAAPLCKCGCGQPVAYQRGRSRGWGDYVHGHALIDRYHKEGTKILAHPNPTKGQITRYPHKCSNCDVQFSNRLKVSKFHSVQCRADYYSGEDSPQWHGGRTKYITDNASKRKEHRVIMERVIGRNLLLTEVVHHIDGNGLNNAIANLFLFHCTRCHSYHHLAHVPVEYRYSLVHSHPVRSRYRPKQIFIRQYRTIYADAHGRKLKRHEVVHHIGNNELNNDVSNLHLFHCQPCRQHYLQYATPLQYKYDAVNHEQFGPNQRTLTL